MNRKQSLASKGSASYKKWQNGLKANPEYRVIYEEESAKSELWIQLAEARQSAGLTQAELAKRLGVSQAQVARIEKSGYASYTLTSLRRYIHALGKGFTLEVKVRQNPVFA